VSPSRQGPGTTIAAAAAAAAGAAATGTAVTVVVAAAIALAMLDQQCIKDLADDSMFDDERGQELHTFHGALVMFQGGGGLPRHGVPLFQRAGHVLCVGWVEVRSVVFGHYKVQQRREREIDVDVARVKKDIKGLHGLEGGKTPHPVPKNGRQEESARVLVGEVMGEQWWWWWW